MSIPFAIGIPTINRADLLNPTLQKYVVDFPDTPIYIVDNGNQQLFEHPNITVHRPGVNMGVAASWNYLCREIFPAIPNALILNDDIYLGKNQDEISRFIEERSDADFLFSTNGWCSFVIRQLTFQTVGDFDEMFYPAYFEDGDYSYRIILAGLSQQHSMMLYPKVYLESMSRARDLSLDANHEALKVRYISKWGGLPGHETFKTPFNK